MLYLLSIAHGLAPLESQMETVFIVGVIAGAGLMAAVIFGTQAWYERRYPILGERS